jgi:alcohol dehydrogenase class IV
MRGSQIMNFNLYMPVKVISGDGCVIKNASEFKKLGNRCLIITGQGSAKKSGALDDVIKALELYSIKYDLFDKVGPNPLVSVCHCAGTAARAFAAEFIVGIGGGSAIDAAKAAAIFAANKSMQPMDIYSGSYANKALPLCFIGTTAGTGSEVTPISVLTIDAQNIKKSINFDDCYATIAFADPIYTKSCPYSLTVSAALDALCHTIEGYYALKGGDVSREFALIAAKLLWKNIYNLNKNPDSTPNAAEREELYYGSLWAGLTLNLALTGFPHPAGYVLTEEYHIPHGKACAVFLPAYIRHNALADKALTDRLFAEMGCNIDELCGIVSELASCNGIKFSKEQCVQFANKISTRMNLTNAINPTTTLQMQAIYEGLFCNER